MSYGMEMAGDVMAITTTIFIIVLPMDNSDLQFPEEF